MIVKVVQLTVVIPQRVKNEEEAFELVSKERLVRQMRNEGREATSIGITRRDGNETEVVINYE